MQIILSQKEIEQKTTRLAHQIIENTFEENTLFLAGIAGNGSLLAHQLKSIIEAHSDQTIEVFDIELNKEEPWSVPITLTISQEKIKNGYIILIDDVINSGKTMQYALVKLLENPTKAIKTVVLVDRKHRRYPIKADFVGLSLSTTLKERVEVEFNDSTSQAYLI
jgi:pyrimidine operon attenuation protein/uracil phosphoribosyltransferase